MAAATRVAQTLQQISYDHETSRGPRKYVITEPDLNAYLRVILKSKAYPGISQAIVDMRDGRIFETRIVVDMDGVELGDSVSATLLRTVLQGDQELVLLGKLVAESGSASYTCLLYTSPSPRDQRGSRMPSSA